MFQGIIDALESGAKDDNVRVTVFTGTGSYYSSGNDMNNFSKAAKHPDGLVGFAAFARNLLE